MRLRPKRPILRAQLAAQQNPTGYTTEPTGSIWCCRVDENWNCEKYCYNFAGAPAPGGRAPSQGLGLAAQTGRTHATISCPPGTHVAGSSPHEYCADNGSGGTSLLGWQATGPYGTTPGG